MQVAQLVEFLLVDMKPWVGCPELQKLDGVACVCYPNTKDEKLKASLDCTAPYLKNQNQSDTLKPADSNRMSMVNTEFTHVESRVQIGVSQ